MDSNPKVKEAKYLCADCGKGSITMHELCAFCGSVRVIAVRFAKEFIGEDYYKNFEHGEPPTVPIES